MTNAAAEGAEPFSPGVARLPPPKGLEGFALAQLTDISHQGMDGALIQGMSPSRHAGSPAHRKPTKLDGLKKLRIGPGFQIFGFGVITGWNREELGVDAVSLAFDAMALGAVPPISFPGIFCNSHRFLLWSLRADFLDLFLCGWFEGRPFVTILPAGNYAEQNRRYCE